MEQQWQTATNRVDVVLLIELHQLLVLRLLLVLAVFVLDGLEFRLQQRHLELRTSALERERRRNNQHHQGQQDDRYYIGVIYVVEEGK